MALKNLKIAVLNMAGVAMRQLVVDPNGGYQMAGDKVVSDEQGRPVPATIEQELIVSDLVINALLTPYNDEPQLSADEKVARFKLAERINATPEAVELSLDDLVTVKNISAKLYSPLVLGRIVATLEG